MNHLMTTVNWQISPTEIRGALGSVNQLFICIGILVALVAGLPLAGNPIWYSVVASSYFVRCLFLFITYIVQKCQHQYWR